MVTGDWANAVPASKQPAQTKLEILCIIFI